MTIIKVCGTSGSGKSTVAREAMKGYKRARPVHVEGRKRPLYYALSEHPTQSDLIVLGHYETACGGCDTITEMDHVFQLARDLSASGTHVLMEGLLISAEFRRTHALAQERPLVVLELDVPLADCLAGVQARRTARGDERPLNPKNTESKHKGVRGTCNRLLLNGVRVERLTREQAMARAHELLGGGAL